MNKKIILDFISKHVAFSRFLLSLMVGFIITVCLAAYSEKVQADLASHVLRLHIIANSDSKEDQALKLKVRDRILKDIGGTLSQEDGLDEVKEIARECLPKIEEIAQDELKKNGKDTTVKAMLGRFPFPTKNYENISLPAGNYEALRVVIGEGKGKNWWCVLFPPLCLVDGTHAKMPEESKEKLQENLTKEEYSLIDNENRQKEIPVEIKFKIVEWFQNSKIMMKTAVVGH